jgi:photosystem II stability/assembly factor-like uncharacterized protein
MTREQIQDVTYALATSPTFAQDGICFAARGSGLYRSDDRGNTWRSSYEALNLESSLPTIAVAVSPDFHADQMLFAGIAGGVLRSFDGGASWLHTSLPLPTPLVSTFILSPDYVNDGVVLLGTTGDGVFRSANRGERWTAWNFGLLDLNILCMDISPSFAQDDTLYVGTESGVFRSTNGGRAWRETDFPMDGAPVLSLALSPNYAHDDTLFAGSESSGLWRSTDGGHTWMQTAENAIARAVNAIILSPRFSAKPDILVLLDDGILLSRDGGATWLERSAITSSEQGAVSVAAPQGLGPGSALLVGPITGDVLVTAV